MKAVLQRVTHASVEVQEKKVGEIKNGFLVLLGVLEGDTKKEVDVLSRKVFGMRVFEDDGGKMNLSLSETDGSVLVVSQFTLLADCKKGNRPSFINAAKPDIAKELYEYFCDKMCEYGVKNVERGVFGADMKVCLLNDGPVTIILDTNELM